VPVAENFELLLGPLETFRQSTKYQFRLATNLWPQIFKETMLHLENAARKVGDAHLHMPIRKSETLPTAQQVNCGQQLDVLLSEIVRITR